MKNKFLKMMVFLFALALTLSGCNAPFFGQCKTDNEIYSVNTGIKTSLDGKLAISPMWRSPEYGPQVKAVNGTIYITEELAKRVDKTRLASEIAEYEKAQKSNLDSYKK